MYWCWVQKVDCLVQEVLKYETVTRVDVVEHFDTASLVRKTPALRSLNHNVFDDKRVQIHEASLFDFVRGQQYDAIFMDLPEAGNRHTAQYYKRETFALLLQALKKDGFWSHRQALLFSQGFHFGSMLTSCLVWTNRHLSIPIMSMFLPLESGVL